MLFKLVTTGYDQVYDDLKIDEDSYQLSLSKTILPHKQSIIELFRYFLIVPTGKASYI